MRKNKLIYFHTASNYMVTQGYMRIVEKAYLEKGYRVEYIDEKDYKRLDPSVAVFVINSTTLLLLYIKGFREFVFWAQGITPEESYMRNHSNLRVFILNKIEKFALKKNKYCFCVSNYQVDYYENKYNIKLRNKTIVMPCFNTFIHPDSFKSKGKYENNIFCYVGSLEVWQCFEETVKYYAKIEQELRGNCSFRIFTKDHDRAVEIINKCNIKNYQVLFIEPEKLSNALAYCKYGFLLREDNPVNNVATPTKLSSYLASGVIPIFSDSIKDFISLSNEYDYLIRISNFEDVKPVVEHAKTTIDNSDVYCSFNSIFKNYYNECSYIDNILSIIDKK